MISKEEYERKKRELVSEFLNAKNKGNVALNKKTSNLFRDRKQGKVSRINVKEFSNVISIDAKNKTAEVEGMATFEDFADETLKYGFMPAVVPQLKTITVGGATTGGGIESSSFRYGLVHETILEMEILTGQGKVVVCSKKRNKDLFYGFPNSYGTLGYALKLKVKLVPVKKHVKLEHFHFSNAEDYFKSLKKYCFSRRYDFVDGVVFDEGKMYLTLGRFVDNAPFVSDYTYMNIYYKSIKEKKVDYVTAQDYLWRWDTDWFWCSEVFGVQSKIFRKLWGKKNLNSRTYTKIMRLNARYPVIPKVASVFGRRESVIQDVEIPVENSAEFLDFFQREIGIKPVWVCPTKSPENVKWSLYVMDPKKLYINFGFWSSVRAKKEEGHYNRLIEKKVFELGGEKSLYSSSYFTENEFWKEYNKKAYEKLKKKYDPDSVFLGLYEKAVKMR